mmetsp:Transcript_20775/g.29136  ORF Transcript_20775/g.29136 Transcript_20775/m.29136 type:complete len:317 (-) Transcript_20775:222-1172(-)
MLSEMFAYCLGAAHHELPHDRLDHFMVSNHRADGEAWEFIDKLEEYSNFNPCMGPQVPPPDAALPLLVHYPGEVIPYIDPSKGGWKFHKKHMPQNIYDCKAKIPGWTSDDGRGPITVTPEQIWTQATSPNSKCSNKHQETDCKRQAWVACYVQKTIQQSILAYKAKFCKSGYSTELDGSLLHPAVMNVKVDPYGAPLSGTKQTREGLKDKYAGEDGSKGYHDKLQRERAFAVASGASASSSAVAASAAATDATTAATAASSGLFSKIIGDDKFAFQDEDDDSDNTMAYAVVLLPALCGICLLVYKAFHGTKESKTA